VIIIFLSPIRVTCWHVMIVFRSSSRTWDSQTEDSPFHQRDGSSCRIGMMKGLRVAVTDDRALPVGNSESIISLSEVIEPFVKIPRQYRIHSPPRTERMSYLSIAVIFPASTFTFGLHFQSCFYLRPGVCNKYNESLFESIFRVTGIRESFVYYIPVTNPFALYRIRVSSFLLFFLIS